MLYAVGRLLSNGIFRFVAAFFIIYGCLYAFNYAWTGLTIPGGSYSAWLAKNGDYISGLRLIILKGASALLSLFSYDNYVSGYYLHINGGKTVRMVYSCIGLNIIFVWWAFIISFPQLVKNKLVYIVAGTMFITLLNMVRIALVAVSPYKGNFMNTSLDHHTVFNFMVYAIIVLVIFRIIDKSNFGLSSKMMTAQPRDRK